MTMEKLMKMDRNEFNVLVCEMTINELTSMAQNVFGNKIKYVKNKKKVEIAQEVFVMWNAEIEKMMEQQNAKKQNVKHSEIKVVNKEGVEMTFVSVKAFAEHLENEFCMKINKGHIYNLINVNHKSKSYKGYKIAE